MYRLPFSRRLGLVALATLLILVVAVAGAPRHVAAQPVTSQFIGVAIDASGEVIVSWWETPGNALDWVSVVRAGAADDTYESTWTYTDGRRSGNYFAGRLAPGDYEARLYYDWPAGGYRVIDRVGFRVGIDRSGVLRESQNLQVSVSRDGSVVVVWRDTPGNSQDWVSVVRAGTPDDSYESTWAYTAGVRSGRYEAGRLAPGDYEARLYLDWPAGGYRVVDRVYFRVE